MVKIDKAFKSLTKMAGSEEVMFKALVEQSKDIILITNKDMVIKYCTDSVEKILGLQPEEFIGRKFFEFVDDDLESALMKFNSDNTENQSTFAEVVLDSKVGEPRYFDLTITNLLADDQSSGIVLNLHDITERKLAENKLLKANNELDHFIYKTSHDLRAPLLTSIGLVELALKDKEDNGTDYLGLIKQSLYKLDSFIEDINSFYRNEKLEIRNERVNIKKVIKDEIDSLKCKIDDKDKVEIHQNITQISELYSDTVRFKTVITNVLSNAIKYSDLNKPSPYINVNIQVTPDECVIRISDNGIGIREQYLDNIFDIFYRADENAKGSGLGLYIVKDTIDKLNGQIEVESEYGKGTTFTISIPNFLN